jgi:hypothetical protein
MAVTVDESSPELNVSAPRAPRVLANSEFRGLAIAQVTSECGDQVAAIAMSLLVYGRSRSPLLAAATYAVTYVPWVLGALWLSPLVDRFPRRLVMQVCDLGRALVIGVLAVAASVRGMPIAVLIGLILLSSLFSPPFATARTAVLPDIFTEAPSYVRAVAAGRILQQIDQVLGFAIGGAVVAGVTPRGALALDAATFLVSYVLITTQLRPRPSALAGALPSVWAMMRNAMPDLGIVLRHPARRALLLFSASSLLFLIAPDSLAVPYARQHGHGAVAAGILAAAQPCGVALGAWLFIKFVRPPLQARLLLPLAACGALMLTATAAVPPVWLAGLLWGLSGVCQAFMVTTIAAYNVVTDRSMRGRANGLAAASISITQGVGFLLWGSVAQWQGSAAGVAWAGVAGLLIVSLVRYAWPTDVIAQVWQRLAGAQER